VVVQVGRTLPFRNYAGYITVDEAHGRKLFFWFAESQNNPSTDPVRYTMLSFPLSLSLCRRQALS
jgi:carboxypeptidase C (cathepsin A)